MNQMTGDISAHREVGCLFRGLLLGKGKEHRNGVAGLPLLVQHLFEQVPAFPTAGRAALQA